MSLGVRVARKTAFRNPRAGLEQQLVGPWRVPADLIEPRWVELIAHIRFRRVHRPIRHIRRAMAVALGIDEEVVLVPLRRLPRHAQRLGLVKLVTGRRPTEVGGVEHRALRQVIVLARGRPLVAPRPIRAEKPQPVPLDRAAQGPARIIDIVDAGRGREAAGPQGVVQVGVLQVGVSVKAGDAAREAVAALLGNHGDHRAVGVGVGRDAARGEHRFLHRFRVGVVALVPLRMLDPHAVVGDVLARLAMVRAADLPGVAAGDVEAFVAAEPGGERHELIQALHTARQHVEQVTGDHGLFAGVRRVDQRGRARHRDRLLERPDPHVRVHRRREPRRQLDAVPLEGAKAGEREGNSIRAGPQIDDVVPALVVGDDAADLFDQGRTGGFHRDAGQHSP